MSHLESILPEHPRFRLERLLGRGSNGTVYAALDHERGERVALKKLHLLEPGALYRFKKEFRSLADLAHPNLVTLFELFADDDSCFLTMELVEGADLVSWARRESEGADSPPEDPEAFAERIRAMLHQLVSGVATLHEANILHRDLKPSNVLVDNQGRPVILDFGLATAAESTSTFDPQTVEAGFAGTITYMAPEQILGQSSSPASDWYAVGAMLFEALTGQAPFTGQLSEILQTKTRQRAPSPAALCPRLPADLVAMCEGWLALEPRERPGAEALQGFENAARNDSTQSPSERWREGLAGRGEEVAALEAALEASHQGDTVALFLHGDSGMGKTALMHGFLETLAREGRATVLAGRCYEREMVPFKALDGVVDRLSKHLLTLSETRDGPPLDDLIPEEIRPLTRLFPVLRRIRTFDRAARQGKASPDPAVLRRRAFAGLRDLLGRLGRLHPLVLFIDDLHWADADSSRLLADLLRPPDAPSLLLIGSFRREEIANQTFLRELLARVDGERWRELRLDPLRNEAAREMIEALLPPIEAGREGLIQTILREAGGSPFFIEQLVSYVRGGRDTLASTLDLGALLDGWLRQLPEGAESFLETLAVAGHPLPAPVVLRAARLDPHNRTLVPALRQACLVRSSGSAEQVEIYHDRLRLVFGERLEPSADRRIHRRLAEALLDHGIEDPEILFDHFEQAGNSLQAAHQAALAAARASEALAFDRAALFYRRALEWGHLDDDDRLPLMRSEAESLALAGRPRQAASAYLAVAAALGLGAEALDLRSRAAQEYLSGGYLEEGAKILRGVLRSIELRIPQSRSLALLSLLQQRIRLKRRGLDYEIRNEPEVPREQLTRIDTCWAAAASLATIQPVQGTDLQTRHLLYALDAGEPRRLARALALEASFVARAGQPARDQAKDLCNRTMALARKVDDPFPLAIGTLHTGITAYLLGEWQRAIELCEEADQLFDEHCSGVLWDQTSAQRYALAAMVFRGDLAEIQRRVPSQLAAAEERGNKLGASTLRTRVNIHWLAKDDPETALQEAELALAGRDGFHLLHYNGLWARNQADLYRGAPAAAFHRLQELWPRLERSLLLRIQILHIEALDLRARTHLAMAGARDREENLRQAARCARKIDVQRVEYGRALAALIDAGIHRLRGNEETAAELLDEATEMCRGADLRLHAAAADFQRGRLIGGDEGSGLVAAGHGFMKEQGVVDGERMVGLLIPGFG